VSSETGAGVDPGDPDLASGPEVMRSGGAQPPVTGDAAVDEALGRLHDSAVAGDLDAQAAAGDAVHQALQARLSDLGGG
jgi:hypothetical protein